MGQVILTVTLNPAVDKMVCVDRLAWGQEARAAQLVLSAGGKGINVSRALKNLGIKTQAIGFCGGVSGRWLVQELSREKIPFTSIGVFGETRTNLTVSDNRLGRCLRVLEAGPRVSAQEACAFKKLFRSQLSQVSCVVLSGNLPQGLPNNFYSQLVSVAQQFNKKVILDTSGMPLVAGLQARPFAVKPNKEEAELAVGYPLCSLSRIKQAAQELVHKGAQNVFITLGKEGAVGTDGKVFFMAKAVSPKDDAMTVGCGDAFIAGFLSGQIRRASFVESFSLAMAAGAANVGAVRPGDILGRKVIQLAKKIHLKEIV